MLTRFFSSLSLIFSSFQIFEEILTIILPMSFCVSHQLCMRCYNKNQNKVSSHRKTVITLISGSYVNLLLTVHIKEKSSFWLGLNNKNQPCTTATRRTAISCSLQFSNSKIPHSITVSSFFKSFTLWPNYFNTRVLLLYSFIHEE